VFLVAADRVQPADVSLAVALGALRVEGSLEQIERGHAQE
jgi:hypothetical protein